MRSKSSAFVVLIGPLIIVALIALAFSNTQDYQISIGVISPDNSELSVQFIQQLTAKNYTVINYDNVETCIEEVKIKSTNLCIQLPENFVIENNKVNEIVFHVDQSRMNIVESIIASVSSTLNLKSEEITLSLTKNLLDTIEYASSEITLSNEDLNNIDNEVKKANSETNRIKSKGENSDLSSAVSALDNTSTQLNEVSTANAEIESDVDDLLKELDDLLDDLEDGNILPTKTNAVRAEYNKLHGNFTTKMTAIDTTLTDLENNFNSLEKELSSARDDLSTITTSATNANTNINNIKTKAENVKTNLQNINNKVNDIKITSAENIVNPTEIKINSILSSSDKSIYMFPYFLILIVLFVGIMLSSTLVVMEKKSRAFFRTFTTPTSELYHVLARYLTNLFIIAIQLSLVFLAAYFYLKISILNNYSVIIVVLLLSSTFFIFLGQLIGYIFKTQEGVTIAAISLGSLFLFMSNVILPIESFSALTRKILNFNPYMLCSELLKKSILFQARFTGLKNEFLILVIYLIVILILVIIFQKISLMRFFQGFAKRKILKMPHVTKERYFKTENGELIKNKKELVKFLNQINEEEFDKYVNQKNNEFALWIKEAFKEKKLATKLKKAKSIPEMIDILSQNLENNK